MPKGSVYCNNNQYCDAGEGCCGIKSDKCCKVGDYCVADKSRCCGPDLVMNDKGEGCVPVGALMCEDG